MIKSPLCRTPNECVCAAFVYYSKQFVLMFGNLPEGSMGGVTFFQLKYTVSIPWKDLCIFAPDSKAFLKAEKEAEVFTRSSYLPFPLASCYSWEAPWCLLCSLLGTSWFLTGGNIFLCL